MSTDEIREVQKTATSVKSSGEVVDLLAALQRSIDAAKTARGEPKPGEAAWTDRQGDVWTLGDDGLLHTPETRPFSREHVEKKWGPLRPAEVPRCPECRNGKHLNCTGQALDAATDEVVACACPVCGDA